MARRRESRMRLEIRAPRRGTVIVAAILYVAGLFGYMGLITFVSRDLGGWLLAAAGGLLLLGAMLRDL